ncbi:Histone-lysine N-methyltransferase NSD2, partial [Fragariocoptes setiger]
PRPRIEILAKPHIKSIASRDELTTLNEPKGEDVFNVGDLVWVKIPGFPYWPGMVSIDPVERIHTKATSHRNFKASHVYHVQYFGDPPSRNWTMPGLTVPFDGPELNLPSKSKKPQAVAKTRKRGYENAIAEACEALTWDRLTRVRRLTYDYVLVDRSSSHRVSTSNRRTKEAVKRDGSGDVYNFDESFDETETMGQPVMVWSKRSAADQSPTPNAAPQSPAPKVAKRGTRKKPSSQPDSSPLPESQAGPETEPKPETDPESEPEPESEPKPDPDSTEQPTTPQPLPPSTSPPHQTSSEKQPIIQSDMTSSEDASSASDFESADIRIDKLCNVCHEEKGTLFYCRGTCLRTMHADCGGSESSSNDSNGFICQECKTGKHPCFVCNSTDGDCVKCSHKNCGKYYHLSCLKPLSYPANIKSDKVFTCPLHYCLSCYTDNPYPRDVNYIKPSKRQLVKCLCCPTAFHNSESCIAAGTISFTSSYVLCPAHRNTKNEKHLNVSWCFSCNEGGKLVCCESCPAAFHVDCLDPPLASEDQYFCFDCLRRKQLHYGDVIWIKLGSYRWWPARITHPNSVPENIMRLSHQKGDFPVYFFGSHDYFWSHRGRVFLFIEEDSTQNYGKSSSSNKKFKQALAEAREECAKRKIEEEQRLEKLKNTEKPRFRLLKSNRPVNNYQPETRDDRQVNRCECQPDGDVLCGSDDCLNRLMMLECRPDTCPVGDKCKNQRFRKREYAVCVPFRTEHAGWGLRTTQDIKKGDFVIEYVGELIDEAECQSRMAAMREKGDTNFYFLTIDKERIIDAGPAANHARFMNHSCQPNCETQKWVVNGQTRVGLFAICDIPAGSELTFNYNLDCRGNEKTKCRSCLGIAIRATQWLPVVVTASIFGWAWYAYVFRLILFNVESLTEQILYLLVFHGFFILSIWSYYQTIFSEIAIVTAKFYLSPEATEQMSRAPTEQHRDAILAFVVRNNNLPVTCRTYSGSYRYCDRCNLIKPDRAHHCSICRICVLKMDHHCPWINNCVSFNNYKFFVLFLGYTILLCVFTAATTFPYFMRFWQPSSNQPNTSNIFNSTELGTRFHILFLFFVSVMICIGLLFLYLYHIHLILKNRSTLEAFRPPLLRYGPDKNAFNLGASENFKQVFGTKMLLWFIPVSTSLGNGITFDQRRELSAGDEELYVSPLGKYDLSNHFCDRPYLDPQSSP